jgi:membrane protein involved in colicin uptake
LEKSPKEKGQKGRPRKSKKVLHIEGDDEDLFATLVAEANEESEDLSSSLGKKKVGKSQEEKEAERLSKEAEKEAKRLAAEVAKKEKEEKAAAEKAEKEAKKEQERLAREAKKVEEEAAKKLKEEQRLKDKAEKEAKLAAEKAAKEAAKSQKSSKKADPKEEKAADEEPDVVKKIEFEGKKYLKSKKTNIVYDYDEYVKNGEQVVVGKWNDTTNKIEFVAAEVEEEEEEEEEYDM